VPSPVPAGYTRGPILFLGSSKDQAIAEQLLQRFWNEAGAYGSRIVVLAVGEAAKSEAERLAALFALWESEQVTQITVFTRSDALAWSSDHTTGDDLQRTALTRATAILICTEAPLLAASVLGGTPLAQLIRRANAQNKAVGAIGAGAAILCQHMAVWSEQVDGTRTAQFAPGLGIINRLLLGDVAAGVAEQESLAQLAAAVGFNPFLIGVKLAPECGVIVYPNADLEVFGADKARVIDGTRILAAFPSSEIESSAPLDRLRDILLQRGYALHDLDAGSTFNFDTRTTSAPLDRTLQLSAQKAAF